MTKNKSQGRNFKNKLNSNREETAFLIKIFRCRWTLRVRVAIWPLKSQINRIWNFLKLFGRKNGLAIWQFLGLFWKLKKIVPCNACFGKMWAKVMIFYKILKSVLVILPKFHQKFGLFYFVRVWPFLKLLISKMAS